MIVNTFMLWSCIVALGASDGGNAATNPVAEARSEADEVSQPVLRRDPSDPNRLTIKTTPNGRVVTQDQALTLVRTDGKEIVALMERMEQAGSIDWDAPIRWDSQWSRLDDRYLAGFAGKQGSPELIRALHERGCNLDREPPSAGPPQQHQMFGTPLHEAASGFARYSPERVRALLHHGCSPRTPDHSAGNTPLHCAVKSGTFSGMVWPDGMERLTYQGTVPGEREGVIRALACAGANVDAKNNVGRTPLEEAVDDRQWTAVSELLRMGADGRLVTPWKPLYVTNAAKIDRWHGAKDVGTYIEKILEFDCPASRTTKRRDPTGNINPNNLMDYKEKRNAQHALQVYKQELVTLPMEEYMMRAVMVKKFGGVLGRALGTGWCSRHRAVRPPDFSPPRQPPCLRLRNCLDTIAHGRPNGARSKIRTWFQKHAKQNLIQPYTHIDEPQKLRSQHPDQSFENSIDDALLTYLQFEYRPDYSDEN